MSRRGFIQRAAGAESSLLIARAELMRGAGNGKIRAGIVGVGLRGAQTIIEFLSGNDDVELVSIGDLYPDNIEKALRTVRNSAEGPAIESKLKADREHTFTGFDSFEKVLASDIDLILLVTPPVNRPREVEAAVAARKHIFAEKPLAVDPVGARRVMAAASKAEDLKLTFGVGAQRRSQPEYQETIARIKDGAIGEIVAAYAYNLASPLPRLNEKPAGMSELEFKIRNWPQYVSIGGDQIVEQHIHNIDVIQWILGRPSKVVAMGGRAWMPSNWVYGDKYDHISAEFTFPNGVICSSHSRHYRKGCFMRNGELVVGTKGRSSCQDLAPRGPLPPKVQEQVNLVKSIRGQGPYVNLGVAVAESTMMTIMARESAFSGQEITWEMIMESTLEFAPPAPDRLPPSGVPGPAAPGQYQFR
ncbi:MAG: Gfo/Idh/MocA family oxidoreductase [Bryobacteraceae bacterium]|nr:Gfo/Idh/MocA family oxidoreductase [Bryobacteraceae bacterium]